MITTLGFALGGIGMYFCLSLLPNEKLLLKLQAASKIRYFFEKFRAEGKKMIAITVENAGEDNTLEVLDCLKDMGTKASFFVPGSQKEKKTQVLDRILNEKHELANQDLEKKMSCLRSEEELLAYINRTEEMINTSYARIGKIPPKRKWFRPETLFYTLKAQRILEDHHYQCVLGDIHSFESLIPLSSVIYHHLHYRIHPGSIITLRCGNKKDTDMTVSILKRLIPDLQEDGYTFHTLSEMEDENQVY